MSGSPIKPSQAARDERGRVNLDELTDADLDYGTDERGLASLHRRLKRAIYTYEGKAHLSSEASRESHGRMLFCVAPSLALYRGCLV